MEHEEAIRTHAAAGYLLGDLAAAQRDEFEDHFAECEACFGDVRDGGSVIAGLPEAVHGESGTHRFIPAFAAAASIAAAIAVVAYQQIAVVGPLRAQIDRERAPRVIQSVTLRDVRASQDVHVSAGSPFVLDFQIPPDPPSPSYTCAIVDARGTARRSVAVSAAEARDWVHVPVPAGELPPGDYTLRVTGTGGVPVVQMGFEVR